MESEGLTVGELIDLLSKFGRDMPLRFLIHQKNRVYPKDIVQVRRWSQNNGTNMYVTSNFNDEVNVDLFLSDNNYIVTKK